jgi:hypothetical protein
MNKKTGDLLEAYRVALFDKHMANTDLAGESWGVFLTQLNHDGWIVNHPNEAFGGFWIWFNEKGAARMFENLGEL